MSTELEHEVYSMELFIRINFIIFKHSHSGASESAKEISKHLIIKHRLMIIYIYHPEKVVKLYYNIKSIKIIINKKDLVIINFP